MRPYANNTDQPTTDMVDGPIEIQPDYSVAEIGWVERIVANPDQESKRQLSARMRSYYTEVRNNPDPTAWSPVPADVLLSLDAGAEWTIFDQPRHSIATARGEVSVAEQDEIIEQLWSGVNRLHRRWHGDDSGFPYEVGPSDQVDESEATSDIVDIGQHDSDPNRDEDEEEAESEEQEDRLSGDGDRSRQGTIDDGGPEGAWEWR